jgi:probable O-glycosylation ligase (exosortase A-associated)
MLRMIFAVGLILFGIRHALRGPFFALLFYLGFAYFRPETWVWGEALQSLNLSFIIGISVLILAFVSSERLSFNLAVWLIILFTLHALVSTLISPYPVWTWVWWKRFSKVAAISVLIIGLVNSPDRFRLTLMVITFALGFEGAKQGWAYIVLRPNEPNANPLEILGDNNGVALGMLMLCTVILALFQTSTKPWEKWVFGFLLIGCLFRSLTSHSRGGLLAFVAMSLVYLLRSQHRIRYLLGMGTVATVLLLSLPSTYWTRMETIGAVPEQRDVSAISRMHFWRVARIMANDHPLFGVGTIGFERAYNDYDPTNGGFGTNRAVHSTWFGVLADQGYVGFVMFVTILLYALRTLSRVRGMPKGLPDRDRLFTYAGALQTALVTLAVGGTFLSYHYVEITWHFIALSFALGRTAAIVTAEEAAKAKPVAVLSPQYQLAN